MNIILQYCILITELLKETNSMENHGDPRDREGESGAEHEEYEFLQETLKDEKKRGRIGKSTIIKCAALGLVFGMAASLGFLR